MTAARTPRAGTTTAAAVVIFVLTALWTLLGAAVVIIGVAVDQQDIVDDLDVTGDLRDALTGVLIGVGLFILAISAWTLILGIKVLQRRSWARWAAVTTFAIFTALALIGLVGAFGNDDANRDGNASPVPSLIGVIANGAVVGLLVSRPTGNDFSRAEAAERGGGPYGWGGQPGWGGEPSQWQGWERQDPPPGAWGQPPPQQGWSPPAQQGWPPPPPPSG